VLLEGLPFLLLPKRGGPRRKRRGRQDCNFGEYGRTWSCAILPVTQGEMLAAISIGQILAVLVTLNLIALSFVAYRIMRRK
jgi:hypothetical protein